MSAYLRAGFWIDALERAIKTSAQSAAAVLSAEAVDILSADWKAMLAVSGMAGLVSILTSVGSARIGTRGTASAVD